MGRCDERDRALQQERMLRLEAESVQREAQGRIAYLEAQLQACNAQAMQVQHPQACECVRACVCVLSRP